MSEVEVFRHQARTVRDVVRLNVDGVTHEDSLIQPRPAGNCLAIVCFHQGYHAGQTAVLRRITGKDGAIH
jgi:hypothetical protein